MIRINLLPHREQKRKERRQQFYGLVGVMFLVGLVIAFLVHSVIGGSIERQESRNGYLKREIAVLDGEIAEIKRLKEQIEALLSRKQVIESLQTYRTEGVHLMNEMARQMPEGVYLKSVKETGDKVQFVGYAQSNARVSMLMRNLEGSPALKEPQLVETKAAVVDGRRVSEFNLIVSIDRKVEADGDAKEEAK